MDLRNLPIAVVAIETGFTKDLLRKWEARYGFPTPTRSLSGLREYPRSQVYALREIKRKLSEGLRVGQAISSVLQTTPSMALRPEALRVVPGDVAAFLQSIRTHDPGGLNARFEHGLTSQGVQRFLSETVAPLIVAVGDSWSSGRLTIHEEHYFTDRLGLFLAELPRRFQVSKDAPSFIITTPPGEQHTLGMAMVRVLVGEAGINCVSLGPQTPLAEMAAAVSAYKAHVLMLSFSAAFPRRLLNQTLSELRMLLPDTFPVWIGGAGCMGVSRLPSGFRTFFDVADVASALRQWKDDFSSTSS